MGQNILACQNNHSTNFVVLFVTSEDIMMYIIIVYCCTPIGDVFTSFQDAIIVYGHWGKPSIVSRGNSPQLKYNKMYF